MRNPLRFFTELIQQPAWISVWVLFLMVINVSSVAFWNEPLAKIIFVTFMLSAALMMGLYSKFGFVKILGIGHIFWIPLLIYIAIMIPATKDDFRSYLTILLISISISLAFDMIDVWRHFTTRRDT